MDMDADSSPLLARLIDHSNPPAAGRHDFKTALQHMNIHSVFDIIRLSEQEFAAQLAIYNDDDAQPVYLKASSAAVQLEQLFRERQVCSDLPPLREKRSISTAASGTGTTYHSLFKEHWDQFCSSTSIAAVDSPTAYLRALYLFALQLEKTAVGQTAIKLDDRRPDLKDLLIDPRSVSAQQPMLSIVNQILLKNIGCDEQADAYPLLRDTWYPYALPYHFHHQQCERGLSGQDCALGELNYHISRRLPVTGEASAYGQVTTTRNDDTQCLLTGLSPEQQARLKHPLVTESGDEKDFYSTYYNWKEAESKGPENVTDFLHCTQLDGEQLLALLAQKNHESHKSPYCTQDTRLTYGACYVNGSGTTAIQLSGNEPTKLQNMSVERFDRVQRMIRLQRWLDIPFVQLDTLIVSAMRCEDGVNTSLLISHNTLRALGVYRYLNRRYGLHAEEFAALLHQLPVHGSGKRVSLFDQVFNRTDATGARLYLDSKPLDASTRQQLCATLNLRDTEDSLGVLIKTIESPRRDVATLSAIYRPARIARLFGVSVMACQQMADLLKLHQTLLSPTLRKTPQGPPDFLDALMQLDWAIRWLKEYGGTPSSLRRQLLLDPPDLDPAVNALVMEFSRFPHRSLSQQVKSLELPQQPTNETKKLQPIDWEATVDQIVLRMSSNISEDSALDEVLSSLSISVQTDRNAHFVTQAKSALLPVLLKFKRDAWALYQRLKTIIDALPQALDNAMFLKKYDMGQHFLRLYTPSPLSTSPLQTLGYLILLLPHANDVLQLQISRQALRRFLINPHWLDQAYSASSLLDLTLKNLYLMQRFKHCVDRYAVSEEQLFNYFEHANSRSNGAAMGIHHKTDEHLAQLLGWSAKEIEGLSNQLPSTRITSMEHLDWAVRCHRASTAIRLPVEMLKAASQLKNASTSAEWKAVAEALTHTDR